MEKEEPYRIRRRDHYGEPGHLQAGGAASIAPRRSWMPYAVAASFFAAFISLGITFNMSRQAPSIFVMAPQVNLYDQVQPVRAGMQAEFSQKLEKMTPETRAVVETNMQVIQEALNEIRAALEEDPENHDLNLLLHNTLQQERRLMQTANTLSL